MIFHDIIDMIILYFVRCHYKKRIITVKELFEQLIQLIHQRQDCVLVTVVESSGSTPRESGARMLVIKDGRIAGTIGGGAVEYAAEEFAKSCVVSKSSAIKEYDLSPSKDSELGMICGGKAKVLFQYLRHKEQELPKVCEMIISYLDNNEKFWIYSSMDVKAKTPLMLLDSHGRQTGCLVHQDELYFVEEVSGQKRVFIFGGGHVARALVPVLSELDFYCVVVDDREDFLSKEAFPTANELILTDFDKINEKIKIMEEDYAVVITRSHEFDYILQKQLLATPIYYIGVMGSKNKTATQKSMLEKDGFSKEDIGRINMPIGIDIKAETLNELAISIAGELIRKRAEQR